MHTSVHIPYPVCALHHKPGAVKLPGSLPVEAPAPAATCVQAAVVEASLLAVVVVAIVASLRGLLSHLAHLHNVY